MKIKYILLTFIVLIGIIIFQSVKYRNLNERYGVSIQNNKAYESQLDVFQEENKAFQFTIDQLRYVNDKSLQQLDSLRNEIGIKDKKIKQMGKIKEYVYIKDSIRVHDTIFCDKDFDMDTILGD